MQPHLLFTLAEPRVLVLAVLCTSITAYLLTLRKKSLDLRFLIASFSCWTAHFTFAVAREAVYPFSAWFSVAEMVAGLTGLVLFIGFAYSFRGNPFPREFRSVVFVTSAGVTACCTLLIYELVSGRPLFWLVGSGLSVVLFVWAETVFLRRWIAAMHQSEKRAFRSFALVFLLSLAAVGIYFLRDLGVFPAGLAAPVSSLLYLSNLVAFTLVYVNNAPCPTTFTVKIVGASLVAVLAVITLMWTVVASSWDESGAISSHHTRTVSAARSVTDEEFVRQALTGSGLKFQRTVVACNYSILASTLFVLIFFPIFFRISLVEPLYALLKAVDRVDAGERNLKLPVRFNDEIGHLTTSFNRMIRSLREAEDGLTCYAESLELKVEQRTAELGRKNEENLRLLLNILPGSIAERLKGGERIIADTCSEVSIVFADIVGFTNLSSRIPAEQVVGLLSDLMSDFDLLALKHGVEKIKTIGDSYMAVAGLPASRPDHAQAAVHLALEMLSVAARHTTFDGVPLQLRIGINSGSVIAGVIGTHKFAYDLWGDAVNTASRMESHGLPGCIQITEATHRLLRHQYPFRSRGVMDIKGKGQMQTYLLHADDALRVPAIRDISTIEPSWDEVDPMQLTAGVT
ncbi:MAG: adenylate/guanylate cyclase domain-containing protein [Bryobacteraceae bacterium]